MSRFVVTGAGGFIGSHLCDRLPHRGPEVVAIGAFGVCSPRGMNGSINAVGVRKGLAFRQIQDSVPDVVYSGHVHGSLVTPERGGSR